ncbi:hypothetical protein Bca4012_051748 [Brassica carinata]
MFKWSKEITPSQVIKLMRAEKDVEKLILVFDSATAEYANGFLHDQSSFGYMVLRFVKMYCFPYAEVTGYVTLLAILVEENQLKLAFKFYKNVREIGLPPTVASLNVLIKALCRNEKTVDAGVNILLEMPKQGCDPDSYTYGTLISGIQEAVELFDRMNLQGLKPDDGLYGKVISGFYAVSKFREAANFLDEMILGGITPNRLTWNIHVRTSNEVVRGLCTSYPTRAFTLYQSMRSRGISVEVETLDSLVKCLCKKGEFQKAVQLVNEIVADGCIPNKGTWKVLIGHTLDKTMVGEASEYLLRDLGI